MRPMRDGLGVSFKYSVDEKSLRMKLVAIKTSLALSNFLAEVREKEDARLRAEAEAREKEAEARAASLMAKNIALNKTVQVLRSQKPASATDSSTSSSSSGSRGSHGANVEWADSF